MRSLTFVNVSCRYKLWHQSSSDANDLQEHHIYKCGNHERSGSLLGGHGRGDRPRCNHHGLAGTAVEQELFNPRCTSQLQVGWTLYENFQYNTMLKFEVKMNRKCQFRLMTTKSRTFLSIFWCTTKIKIRNYNWQFKDRFTTYIFLFYVYDNS